MNHQHPRPPRRAAFTLIELLVAISVIIVLAAITIAVGPSVLNTRRAAATEQIVVSLDGVLETYIQENQGRVPPNNSTDYLTVWDRILGASSLDEDVIRTGAIYGSENGLEGVDSDIEPVFTDSNGEDFTIRPSSAMFFLQAEGLTPVEDALGRLPDSRLAQVFGNGAQLTAVVDMWGNASRPYERHILYVHPSNVRAQQLYGYCEGGRPYFLSAGQDGVYGSIHDLPAGRRAAMRNGSGQFSSNQRIIEFFQKAREDNIASYDVRPAPIADPPDLQLNPED